MIRSRYEEWGINDKNRQNRPRRRVAAASRGLATQMVLLQSPRIVELEDDESHVVQDLDSHQNGPELLDRQILLADLRTGSPHAALVSLDPRVHEIMNGLADWCDALVNFPFGREEETSSDEALESIRTSMRELQKTESEQAWRRLADVCSVDMVLLTLRRTCNLLRLLGHLIAEGRPFDEHFDGERQNGNAWRRSRTLQFFCQHIGQILGPQHPVTLLCFHLAHGLPFAPLLDIMEGIVQIQTQRESIIRRRKLDEPPSGIRFVMTREGPSVLVEISFEIRRNFSGYQSFGGIKVSRCPVALTYICSVVRWCENVDSECRLMVQKGGFRIGELNPGLVGTDHLSMSESDKS
jgi:hypothetical protein